jgi:ribonuclease J
MDYPPKMEVRPQDIKRLAPSSVMILLAGSQAQLESALMRISQDQDRDIRINKGDTVIFSADPIPGNEVNINGLIDTISKKEAKVVYSEITDEFHVSGHGSEGDLKLLLSLTAPKFVLPIGGTYRQMIAYREIARSMGYTDNEVIFADESREVIFTQSGVRYGKSANLPTVYIDQISGETVDHFVVMDRQKIAEEGVVIVMAEIESGTGQLASPPDIITRGVTIANKDKFIGILAGELNKSFQSKRDRVTNWIFFRKTLQQKTEEILFKDKREPLVVPVILEV